jgi:hypothetical protein
VSDDVVSHARDGDVGSLVIDKPPLKLFDRELVAGLKEGVGKPPPTLRARCWSGPRARPQAGGQDLPVPGTRQVHVLR